MGREWIDRATADHVREQGCGPMAGAADGWWPPPVVFEWTLERCRSVLGR